MIKRETYRYPPIAWGQKAMLFDGDKSVRVEIVNESLRGVGVRVDAGLEWLQLGRLLILDNGSFGRPVEVEYVEPDAAGGFRIGLMYPVKSKYCEHVYSL